MTPIVMPSVVMLSCIVLFFVVFFIVVGVFTTVAVKQLFEPMSETNADTTAVAVV